MRIQCPIVLFESSKPPSPGASNARISAPPSGPEDGAGSLFKAPRLSGSILLIKVGSTLPGLAAQRGDFEAWTLAGMQVDPARVTVIDARNGHPLPALAAPEGKQSGEPECFFSGKPECFFSGEPECFFSGEPECFFSGEPECFFSGVIITGSHAMVTERQPWSEALAAWLPGLVERGIPLLGICYGHQLLAHALGGEVGDNPRGREFGTVAVHLNARAAADPLLGGFPSPMHVHAAHTQSVLRLPPGAKLLAASEREPHAAFVVGRCAWGVQFHPEFDATVTRAYIREHRGALRAEGQDPEALLAACRETPHGGAILRRFAALCAGSAPAQEGAPR